MVVLLLLFSECAARQQARRFLGEGVHQLGDEVGTGVGLQFVEDVRVDNGVAHECGSWAGTRGALRDSDSISCSTRIGSVR